MRSCLFAQRDCAWGGVQMRRVMWVLLGLAACMPQRDRAREPSEATAALSVAAVDRMVATVAVAARCGAVACDEACEAGDAKACARAAELSWRGEYGVAFDPPAAFAYARRGCDGGDALACTLVGRHMVTGVATPWAPAVAVAVFEKACAGGSGLGCLALGNLHAQRHGIDGDPGKAEAYGVRARDTFRAQCLVEPRWCAYVHSPKGSPAELELAQRACKSGVPASCVDVMLLQIHRGWHGGSVALERMCAAGERSGCVALARLGLAAELPNADAKAMALMTRACTLGAPDGCLHVGRAEQAAEPTDRSRDIRRRAFERGCALASGRACRHAAEDAFIEGRAAESATYAQRACELAEEGGCELLLRNHLEQHDDAGADRWAKESCRLGGTYGCERLVDRDLALPRMPTVDQPPSITPASADASRIAGQRNIVPDNRTKTAIARARKTRLVGSFKVCIDVTGRVTEVSSLKSTGFPAYDQKIDQTIRTWRYRPIWAYGRPASVCTAVTFIYRQAQG